MLKETLPRKSKTFKKLSKTFPSYSRLLPVRLFSKNPSSTHPGDCKQRRYNKTFILPRSSRLTALPLAFMG